MRTRRAPRSRRPTASCPSTSTARGCPSKSAAPPAPPTIGLVVETQCNYFAPLVFPQRVEAGLRVARLGSSSVRYEIGLFAHGEASAAAQGHFVHVYVDRATRRPVPLPEPLRAALAPLVAPAA